MEKICIAVGHGTSQSGGYDSGALSKDGKTHEFRVAREIALEAYNALRLRGIECSLINYNGNLSLTDRIELINKESFTLAVEIHLNAGGGTGTEVYYSKASAQGKKLAQAVSKNISERLGVRNRGAKTKLNDSGRDYFGFIRQIRSTAMLVETVFIDNDGDLSRVAEKQGQKACGEAIAAGLVGTAAGASSFLVKIRSDELNVRTGPGTEYDIALTVSKGDVYTIVATDKTGRWGKLKSGAGWISIDERYVQRVK